MVRFPLRRTAIALSLEPLCTVVCASKAGKAAEGTIVAAFKEVMELEESNGVLEAEEYMSMLWHLQQMGLYRQVSSRYTVCPVISFCCCWKRRTSACPRCIGSMWSAWPQRFIRAERLPCLALHRSQQNVPYRLLGNVVSEQSPMMLKQYSPLDHLRNATAVSDSIETVPLETRLQ